MTTADKTPVYDRKHGLAKEKPCPTCGRIGNTKSCREGSCVYIKSDMRKGK